VIDAIGLVLRAASLVLSFQAAGAALFSLLNRPQPLHADYAARLAVRAALAGLCVFACEVPLALARLGGDWSSIWDGDLLKVWLSSSAAQALAVAALGLIVTAAALRHAVPRTLALAGALLSVAANALTGHTSVLPLRGLAAPLLLLHLSIIAFWFGALLPLRHLINCAPPAAAVRALERFSASAVWLVPLIGVSGLALVLLLLPDAAAVLAPYGLLLLVKLALYVVLLAIAAGNRQRLTPALARGADRAPRALRSAIALEYVLMCVVFMVTSVMTGRYSP
jgi:putative copper export protein